MITSALWKQSFRFKLSPNTRLRGQELDGEENKIKNKSRTTTNCTDYTNMPHTIRLTALR